MAAKITLHAKHSQDEWAMLALRKFMKDSYPIKEKMIQFDFDETAIPDAAVKALIDRAYGYVYNRLTRKAKETLI